MSIVRVPKKYQKAIKEIWKDQDGWWATLNNGYVSGVDENSVINGEDWKQIREAMDEIHRGDHH